MHFVEEKNIPVGGFFKLIMQIRQTVGGNTIENKYKIMYRSTSTLWIELWSG